MLLSERLEQSDLVVQIHASITVIIGAIPVNDPRSTLHLNQFSGLKWKKQFLKCLNGSGMLDNFSQIKHTLDLLIASVQNPINFQIVLVLRAAVEIGQGQPELSLKVQIRTLCSTEPEQAQMLDVRVAYLA